MKSYQILFYAALTGALAVILGALGAHALETRLPSGALESFVTGVRYQAWHALALMALAALGSGLPGAIWVSRLWLWGLLLFSGSIYLLSTQSLHGWPMNWLGPVTPVGGLLLIAGWLRLAWSARQAMAARGK